MAGVLIGLKLLYQLLGCGAQATNLLLAPTAETLLGLRHREGGVGRVGPSSTVPSRGTSKDLVIQRGGECFESNRRGRRAVRPAPGETRMRRLQVRDSSARPLRLTPARP